MAQADAVGEFRAAYMKRCPSCYKLCLQREGGLDPALPSKEELASTEAELAGRSEGAAPISSVNSLFKGKSLVSDSAYLGLSPMLHLALPGPQAAAAGELERLEKDTDSGHDTITTHEVLSCPNTVSTISSSNGNT